MAFRKAFVDALNLLAVAFDRVVEEGYERPVLVGGGAVEFYTSGAIVSGDFDVVTGAEPETFDFLGFTFICGKSRNGKFLIHRKSRRDRVRAKLKDVKEELRRQMHGPLREQAEWLKQVVTGFFQYHAVPTNGAALGAFRHHVIDLWRRTLRRRGQTHRMTWRQIGKLADDWLPKPRILHPWPNQRFAVKHPRWDADARIGPVRFWCSEASCYSSG